MNKKTATPTQGTQFRAQEEAAFHAWREWPVLLVLRRQELLTHRGAALSSPPQAPTRPTSRKVTKHD